MNPPVRTIAKPIQFQAKSSCATWAAVARRLPTPNSRRSRAKLVPNQIERPVKCISCTNGYAHIDSRVINPQGVPSNHFANATSVSCIGAILFLPLKRGKTLAKPFQGGNFGRGKNRRNPQQQGDQRNDLRGPRYLRIESPLPRSALNDEGEERRDHDQRQLDMEYFGGRPIASGRRKHQEAGNNRECKSDPSPG